MNRMTITLYLLVFILNACQSHESGAATAPEPAAPTSAAVSPPAELAQEPTAAVIVLETETEMPNLGNLTFSGILPDQLITLVDGFAYYDDEGGGRPYVRLIDELIAAGDLNGDGAEDAVAFLVDNTTGSADFVYLTAVLSAWTEPTPLEALLIGDRTPVISLNIEGSEVITEIIAPGPDDVLCCPTRHVRKLFHLQNGRLVESSSVDLGQASLAGLNGTSWRLVDLNLDQEPLLPGIEVTLHFDEGQINGSGGCNDYSSVISGEQDLPQALVVGPIAATGALCSDPLANQQITYFDRLAKVVAWRYDFGRLSLTYKLEDDLLGELLFAPPKP